MTAIEYASSDDLPFLCRYDPKKPQDAWAAQVAGGEVIIARLDGQPVGYLRFGQFWDHLPMMKELQVLPQLRRQGIGRKLAEFWEDQMKHRGYRGVLTTTISSESGQHFYRKCGYVDVGAFVLPGEPLEIMLYKRLC